MAKSKKKHEKAPPRRTAESAPESGSEALLPAAIAGEGSAHEVSTGNSANKGGAAADSGDGACSPADAPAKLAAPVPVLPASRLRRALPDIVKVFLAFAVIGVAAVIWYKPPLIIADYPRVTYRHGGEWMDDATLYRPLAMPTRFYVGLPRKLAGRYEWFTVDRRREVVALAEEPQRRFMGRKVITRGEPLGLDLEFRKIDGSEWQIFFFDESIVFSNAVLAVRLDVGKNSGK